MTQHKSVGLGTRGLMFESCCVFRSRANCTVPSLQPYKLLKWTGDSGVKVNQLSSWAVLVQLSSAPIDLWGHWALFQLRGNVWMVIAIELASDSKLTTNPINWHLWFNWPLSQFSFIFKNINVWITSPVLISIRILTTDLKWLLHPPCSDVWGSHFLCNACIILIQNINTKLCMNASQCICFGNTHGFLKTMKFHTLCVFHITHLQMSLQKHLLARIKYTR
jgi:hypothetical protein